MRDKFARAQQLSAIIENRKLREEVTNLRQMLDKRYGFESIIGRSEAMEHLFEQMKMVAPTPSSVLVIGDSGTGKELVANAIHLNSPRAGERFLASGFQGTSMDEVAQRAGQPQPNAIPASRRASTRVKPLVS